MSTGAREFYTAEEYAAAKQVDAAAFLMSIGYGLTRAGHCYQGKLHDSLIIRDDGRWYWNSRQLHGYSPIELYKHILLNDYGYSDEITAAIAAVKQLAGAQGAYTITANAPREPPQRSPDEPLILPAPFKNNNRVMAYLCKTRGLDPEIVRGLMRYGKIYETVQSWNKERQSYEDTPYHNAVFVAYDKDGRPQNAFLRGTISLAVKPFKKDVDGSNKSYPFTLSGFPNSDRVFCFEGAIDAISHASIAREKVDVWRYGHRLSLGGTSFLGLDRFLADNPQITNIVACLDNDPTGDRRSAKLAEEYTAKGYTVERETPVYKDFNEDLQYLCQEEQEGEMEL
jgi:hypothetical protein